MAQCARLGNSLLIYSIIDCAIAFHWQLAITDIIWVHFENTKSQISFVAHAEWRILERRGAEDGS